MEKEIAEAFLHKYVKLEKLTPAGDRPFKLFGTIEKVTDETIMLKTEQGLGATRLIDIISIVEWRDKYAH